jgi:hypothetical protein
MSTHKAEATHPSWRQVFELWQSYDVPEVEVVPWDLNSPFQGPWDTRTNGSSPRGYYPCSNPEFQTADDICHLFPKLTSELRAAYKLKAYSVQNDLGGFESALLYPILSKHREEIGYLWHPNARHVIPVNCEYTIQGGRLEPKQIAHWREITRLAAQTWLTLARDWLWSGCHV